MCNFYFNLFLSLSLHSCFVFWLLHAVSEKNVLSSRGLESSKEIRSFTKNFLVIYIWGEIFGHERGWGFCCYSGNASFFFLLPSFCSGIKKKKRNHLLCKSAWVLCFLSELKWPSVFAQGYWSEQLSVRLCMCVCVCILHLSACCGFIPSWQSRLGGGAFLTLKKV